MYDNIFRINDISVHCVTPIWLYIYRFIQNCIHVFQIGDPKITLTSLKKEVLLVATIEKLRNTWKSFETKITLTKFFENIFNKSKGDS